MMDWIKNKLCTQSKEQSWNLQRANIFVLLNFFFSKLLGVDQFPPPQRSHWQISSLLNTKKNKMWIVDREYLYYMEEMILFVVISLVQLWIDNIF